MQPMEATYRLDLAKLKYNMHLVNSAFDLIFFILAVAGIVIWKQGYDWQGALLFGFAAGPYAVSYLYGAVLLHFIKPKK
jgi:hypothetical protein